MLAYEYADESTVAFGQFRLDLNEKSLTKSGKVLRLSRKVFDVIAYLAVHRGTVVTPNELIDAVWSGEAITDSNVAQHICLARRALDDARKPHRVICTIHGRGYVFSVSCKTTALAQAVSNDDANELVARELYQNGKAFERLSTPASLRSALELYKRAAEISPLYEPAFSGAAETHMKTALRLYQPPSVVWEKAREAAERALKLDSHSVIANSVMACVTLCRDHDSSRASAYLRLAARIRPDLELVHTVQSMVYLFERRPQRALTTVQDGMNWTPGSMVLRMHAAMCLFYMRSYADAIRSLKVIIALEPAAAFARYLLGASYLFCGNIEAARETLSQVFYEDALQADECDFSARQHAGSALAYLEARYGKSDVAERLYGSLAERAVAEVVSPVSFAVALAGFGRAADAAQKLREARGTGDPRLVFAPLEPFFLHFEDSAAFERLSHHGATRAGVER